MKKTGIVALLLFLLIGVAGCGQSSGGLSESGSGEVVDELREAGEETDSAEGTSKREKAAEGDKGTAASGTEIEGLIEEQSFMTTLDGWGEVMFASIAPVGSTGEPEFALVKEGEIRYRFPASPGESTDPFTEVSAVSFRDYNGDGKEDIIVLITYGDGTDTRNSPRIFLQENSDDMFYLDHPDLESYRLTGSAVSKDAVSGTGASGDTTGENAGAEGGKTGAGFYRDTFLEEYLTGQGLTENMSDLLGAWPAYVEYADSFSGYGSSPERQMALFARYKDVWTADVEFADESYCFTVRDLDYDGRMELIVSNYGGTGHYTYSRFYKIDEEEKLKELETSFTEGDSQPDLIVDRATVYSSFSPQGMRDYYLVYDEIKDSPDSYVYRASSLCVTDDFVLETPLATQTVVYEGEDYTPRTSSVDCNGNALSEEEYENFPEKYYDDMGLTKREVSILWTDVSQIKGMSQEEAEAFLKETYL